jgi:hypothetical protein
MTFNFDTSKVVSDMLRASAGALSNGGKQATEYATHEYSQFISDIQQVQNMAEAGTISSDEAQALVDQHKLSMQAVLITIEGLGVIAVQNAINAAMAVLNSALQTAVQGLKFSL